MLVAFLLFAALALVIVQPSLARADRIDGYSTRPHSAFQRSLLGRDASAASTCCAALQPTDSVYYRASQPYTDAITRYFHNTVQQPACVFKPQNPDELAAGLKVIGAANVSFAVSSGRHAYNTGFSTTTGVQIDLKGFQHVTLAGDKSFVDIGSGNVWDNVYQVLAGTGVNVLGARVSGVGVGGMLSGGGGLSFLTNQYGLGVDTLLQANMVLPNGTLATVSETAHADLFWAIKGGGNQFGIVYNWRMKTVAQPCKVYGGFRTYLGTQTDAMVQAISDFALHNRDARAAIIPTFNSIAGSVPLVSISGYYDGPDPGVSLAAFDNSTTMPLVSDEWKTTSYLDLIRSTPVNLTAGARGLFHSVSLRTFTPTIIRQIANQSAVMGSAGLLRSAKVIGYSIDPFIVDWAKGTAKDAAWPRDQSPQPLEISITWTDPSDDEYYHNLAKESIRVITEQANAEGQNVQTMASYPNYVLADTPSEEVFRGNLARLSALKRQYDPTGIMRRTTYFDF